MRAIKTGIYMPLIPAVVFAVSMSTTYAVHAATLSDVISRPIGTTTDIVEQTVAPARTTAQSPSSQSTSPANSSASDPTAETGSSQPAQSSATTDRTASPSTATATATNVSGDISGRSLAPVAYGTGQITPNVANSLYKIAGLAAVAGLILYALTVLPQRRKPTGPKSIISRSVRFKTRAEQ